MSHVYLKVLNWLLKEVQEFSMPKEAMLFVRFDGLTTMIAAKHLTPGMEIVDEGQIMIVQSAAIEPEFGDDLDSAKMILCEHCGNKRCPHASDHRLECTGSNAPGQPGSVY